MLDSAKTYATYDPDDLRYGVEHLAEQARVAWHATRRFRAPTAWQKVTHVVVVGMGGSALPADVAASAFAKRLRVPVTIVRDYTLPAWVDKQTLVILSSFSGITEEVCEAAQSVRKRRLKAGVITTGGPLFALAQAEKWPTYCFSPGDLAKEPRLGTGFSLMGMLGMLRGAGLVRVDDGDVQRMREAMGDVLDTCAVDIPTAENPAKTVAHALTERNVLIVAAEHLAGNAHVLQNQVNESGKQFGVFVTLPELNHHVLEGLLYPKTFAKHTTALLLRSSHYHARTQKRFDITADMFERLGMEVIDYVAGGKDAIEECGEVLQFGSFVTYYLGMCNKVNPRFTPFVAELKQRLMDAETLKR